MNANIRGKIRHYAAVALRMICVFTLVFGMCRVVPRAIAAEGDAQGGEGTATPTPTVEPTPEPEPAAGILVLNVYLVDASNNYTKIADSNEGVCPTVQRIDSRGGSLQFAVGTLWSDGSDPVINDSRVSWTQLSGSNIASLYPGGLLQAGGTEDGSVSIQASVSQDTATGGTLSVTVNVEVAGQTDSLYVSSIDICDEEGNPVEDSFVFTGEIAVAMAEFGADVEVVDPAAGSQTSYHVTAANTLSSQTDGKLPDLEWDVTDPSIGVITYDGMYRPMSYATNMVTCSSTAGPLGQTISDSITVMMENENAEDDRHPQDSLYVYVTYSEDETQTIVAEKTYSVSDIESLGTVTCTYTGVQSGLGKGFYTRVGRGVWLSTLLADVGVNDIDSIETVATVSYDGPDAISGALLFDTNRYYFPNYSLNGSYADAVQVPPMLALETCTSKSGVDDPTYDPMQDSLRFCLLYGATMSGETNAQHQRKWVNTVHVILWGSAPVQPSPSGGGGGGGDEPGGGGGTGGGDDPSSPASASGEGSTDVTTASNSSASAGTADGSGKFSVYQLMNPFQNDVDTISPENPFAPFVIPCGAGAIAVGAVEYGLWYRGQRRRPYAEAAAQAVEAVEQVTA